MRSELCSWSRSLTNRSFCGEMPRGQVSRGMEAGAAPLPAAPASAPQPARPCPAALPPCLPSCLHPCLPSLVLPPCAWVLGCPRSSPCSPVTGARWQLSVAPGHAWPLQSGDPSVQDREAGACTPSALAVPEGDGGTPALPAQTPPSLGSRQEHGGGCSIAPPGCAAPGTKPSESSGKKGMGRAAVLLGLRLPSFGSELLQDKARPLETKSVVG